TNGLLHLASDELTTERIAAPFWEIVTDAKWATVDQEMKEALDRLDHGHDDAFTHATDALEARSRSSPTIRDGLQATREAPPTILTTYAAAASSKCGSGTR